MAMVPTLVPGVHGFGSQPDLAGPHLLRNCAGLGASGQRNHVPLRDDNHLKLHIEKTIKCWDLPIKRWPSTSKTHLELFKANTLVLLAVVHVLQGSLCACFHCSFEHFLLVAHGFCEFHFCGSEFSAPNWVLSLASQMSSLTNRVYPL